MVKHKFNDNDSIKSKLLTLFDVFFIHLALGYVMSIIHCNLTIAFEQV